MLHHPLAAAGVAWWGLLAVVVNLNTGALWIGLAPTIAVVANYYLSGRRARQIAATASSQVAEVHTLVNNRSEQQDEKIAAQGVQIAALETELAQLRKRRTR